jgi:hypothetical protein
LIDIGDDAVEVGQVSELPGWGVGGDLAHSAHAEPFGCAPEVPQLLNVEHDGRAGKSEQLVLEAQPRLKAEPEVTGDR